MNRNRQIIAAVAGIIFAILLFLFATFLPGYINDFMDEKTLDHITSRTPQISEFALSYDGFNEKLNRLAGCNKQYVTSVKEEDILTDNEKITRIVQNELDLLAQENLFLQDILKAQKLVSCETYTLYRHDSPMNITYWKVVYQQNKATICVWLDREYYRIYALRIKKPESAFPAFRDYCQVKTKSVVGYYDKTVASEELYQKLYDQCYYQFGKFVSYHKLQDNEMRFRYGGSENQPETAVWYADITLDAWVPELTLVCQWKKSRKNKNDYVTWNLGMEFFCKN